MACALAQPMRSGRPSSPLERQLPDTQMAGAIPLVSSTLRHPRASCAGMSLFGSTVTVAEEPAEQLPLLWHEESAECWGGPGTRRTEEATCRARVDLARRAPADTDASSGSLSRSIEHCLTRPGTSAPDLSNSS